MRKTLKWILIALGVIFIGVIAYTIIKQSLREEAELTFPETVIVQNTTDFDSEKIIKTLVYNVLRIDTIKIITTYMPKNMEKVGDIKIEAYVTKNPFIPHYYFIFLNRTSNKSQLKKILSHEMIHIRQMEEGDLIQFAPDDPIAIWKGDTINYLEVPYAQRPHEMEAHKLDDKIFKELDKVWYK